MPITEFTSAQFAEFQVPSMLLSMLKLLVENRDMAASFQFQCALAPPKRQPVNNTAKAAATPSAKAAARKDDDAPVPEAIRAYVMGTNNDIRQAPLEYTLRTRNKQLRKPEEVGMWRNFLLSERGSAYVSWFLSAADVHLRINVCRKVQVWLYVLRDALLRAQDADIMAESFFVNSRVAVFVALELFLNLGFAAGVRTPKTTGKRSRAAANNDDNDDGEVDEDDA